MGETPGGPVALIDYGAGNLHSVRNALAAVGAEVVVTANPDEVRRAARIVLPGVGSFGACANGLRSLPGMVAALEERVLNEGVPFLGVCVGMQLLADRGHEFGPIAGLGWIGGEVRAMQPGKNVRVPHMGWNDVTLARPHPVLAAGEAYFLHSYRFVPRDAADALAMTDHGGPVTAAVARGNVLGVQFHPEKSQGYGLDLLRRFVAWDGRE